MKILISIDVPELEPAIVFYRSALGLTLSRVLDGDVAELVGASSVIYLLRKDAASKCWSHATDQRNYARHWTPVHIDFVVENIDEAQERALNAGAIRESECIEWRGSKCVTFGDPFGNGFCLIEFDGGTYSDE